MFRFTAITNPFVPLSVSNLPQTLVAFHQFRIDEYRIAKRDDSASLRRVRVADGCLFAHVTYPDHKSRRRIAADGSTVYMYPSSLEATFIRRPRTPDDQITADDAVLRILHILPSIILLLILFRHLV